MLPSTNRLKKKNDFDRIFKQGRGLREDFMLLRFIKNDLKLSRFGFMVGQKVSKKATARNKIKRRLKALVKSNLLKIKNGVDVVFMVSPSAKSQDFKEIEKLFNSLLKKANLI